ncbi:MAG TPA: helix-turn-helix domain-containing protein [Candidatus Krumholzibacteriaceae bacterium]|nr:helix-turn-helix domain-containing protein [Candidatus Krumholzibacteriaceae bacterium]
MEPKVNQVKYNLMNMGLNEYQASALAHLMYLGETKATTLSKASGVPNARIYGVLDELSQKGLLIMRPGRPALYAPLSPEEIADALVSVSREEVRRRLSVVESYRSEFESAAAEMYLKAGASEQRTGLIRVVSVGDVSIEETRKLYRSAKETLLISTRAMEYFQQVNEDLADALNRGVSVKILMRSPESLSESDREKQDAILGAMGAAFEDGYEVRFSDEVEIRGCVVDPADGGKALFLVEEEGVPFFLREAALTFHPGVVRALGAMFDLKWRFDSRPA